MQDEFKKIKEVTDIIADRYFVDPSTEEVGSKKVDNYKTLMGVFSCLGKKNTLLVGSPGTGKTTFSGVISSVLSGLPFDIYDVLKIQGHPDQTKDTMLARADLGRLAEEGVVWQPSLYLPALTLDELNRLTPGKQAIILEYIRTGAVEHLGKPFSRGKIPFFATINYNGAGTYPVPTNSLDRFDISLELGYGKSTEYDAKMEATRRIEKELKDPEFREILTGLLNKDTSANDKVTFLAKSAEKSREKRLKTGLKIPQIDDPNIDEIIDTSWTPDATTYLRCIVDEINQTKRYGENRRSDIRDTSDHNKTFASAKVIEGISYRFYDAAKYYAGMLARYLGDEKVDIHHLVAVAPYCMAHRLEFTDDYKSQFNEQARLKGERQEHDMTRRILKEIKTNYDNVEHDIKLLDSYIDGKTKMNTEIKKIITGPEPDHPLLKSYYDAAKNAQTR